MLSIPDPHGPNEVRGPYNKMFNNIDFQLPKTAVAAYNKQPANPGWVLRPVQTDLEKASTIVKSIEMNKSWQQEMRNYFGMVKLLDNKVGELLSYIKQRGQDNNTIVVFTSDHGDMLSEHGQYNKGSPYKTSVGVPFIIRYSGNILKGKVVKTAFTTPDFAPTILSIMGIDHSDVNFHGIDGSDAILNSMKINKKEQIRFMYGTGWVAAVNLRYKLVLSTTDRPYLFNLNKNPRELVNFYDSDVDRAKSMGSKLLSAMKEYQFFTKATIFFDPPPCQDSKDQIPYLQNRVCDDLLKNRYKKKCKVKNVIKFCPNTCRSCCKDSKGFFIHFQKKNKCKWIKKKDCRDEAVKKFCPLKCNVCRKQKTV